MYKINREKNRATIFADGKNKCVFKCIKKCTDKYVLSVIFTIKHSLQTESRNGRTSDRSVVTQDIYLLHKMYGKQCWSSGCASI